MSDIESIIADIDRLNTNTGEPFYASVWDDTDVREAIKYNAPDVEFTDEMYDEVKRFAKYIKEQKEKK